MLVPPEWACPTAWRPLAGSPATTVNGAQIALKNGVNVKLGSGAREVKRYAGR
jgi:hypothetical protein